MMITMKLVTSECCIEDWTCLIAVDDDNQETCLSVLCNIPVVVTERYSSQLIFVDDPSDMDAPRMNR
jgi:hypothetical protein